MCASTESYEITPRVFAKEFFNKETLCDRYQYIRLKNRMQIYLDLQIDQQLNEDVYA